MLLLPSNGSLSKLTMTRRTGFEKAIFPSLCRWRRFLNSGGWHALSGPFLVDNGAGLRDTQPTPLRRPVPFSGGGLMKPRIILGWLILAVLFAFSTHQEPAAAQQKKSLKARLKSALKDKQAWTLDEVMAQLNLYPKDAYLQYVALQLARREHRADEIGAQIESLIGDEVRQQRMERANGVDLFSIFSGALAVQESLQLDTMRGEGARRGPPGGRMPVPSPGGARPDMKKAPPPEKDAGKAEPGTTPPPAGAKDTPPGARIAQRVHQDPFQA